MYSYEVEKAIQAACVLHNGQVRKGGSVPIPYVSHLFSVFSILLDYTTDEATLVAALLHDTLEDTDYTPENLQEDFGEAVLSIVAAVTEDKSLDWQARKDGYLLSTVAGGEASLLVSAADKIHNMRSLIEQYHEDIPRYLHDFPNNTGPGLVFLQKLSNALNSGLKNDIVHEFNHVLTEFKTFNEHAIRQQEASH